MHQEPTSQGPRSTHNLGPLAEHPENAPSPEQHPQYPHAAPEPGTPALLTQPASATAPGSESAPVHPSPRPALRSILSDALFLWAPSCP